MFDAVIHVGMPKTGSSSLQTALSTGSLDGSLFEYCVVDPDGTVVSGATLRTRAAGSSLGYVSSSPVLDQIDGDRVRLGLNQIRARGRIPVLSHEYWSMLGGEFNERSLLPRWGIYAARVVAYVRPQLEYFNSGWWQWWAWNGMFERPEDVIREWGTGWLDWHAVLTAWESVAGVKALTVQLQAPDTVSDFFALLSLALPEARPRINRGMSRTLVQLYQAVPGLRDEHSSDMDSILFPFVDSEPTPWVVPRELAETIVESCRAGNALLAEMLPAEATRAMLDDQRWWSAEVYPTPDELEPLSGDDAIDLLRKLVPDYVQLIRRVGVSQRTPRQ